MLPRTNELQKKGARAWMAAAAFLCLTSCAVGPDYHEPDIKMPDTFAAAGKTQKTAENRPVIDAALWWRSLHDEELNSLIDRAIDDNPSLEIALDRMQEARTEEVVVMGGALPEIDISAGGGGGSGSDLARGRVDDPLIAGENTNGLRQVTHIAGFDANWELDVFGQYRRAIEASEYDTQAAIAARNDVLIAVIADVARAYIDMRSLQMQLAVLRKNIDVAKEYLRLTQERYENGITNELDLTLAQRELATMEAERMPLAAQIKAAQYVIAVLLGKFPEDFGKELNKPEMIPALPEKIDAGLPLDLLRRRPDIREAEREAAAATARIGVAEADLFPQIAISGGAGYEGQGLGVAPNLTHSIWSVGPSISWPVLDFGALDALVDIADLRAREMLTNYKQTILNAVREVDTSYDAYTAQQDKLNELGKALMAAQRAVSLANQRYERGLTDSLNVVDAERQEYQIEAQYVSAEQMAAEQFIALYRALGGGWEQYQSFPPIRQPEPAVLAAFTSLVRPHDLEEK